METLVDVITIIMATYFLRSLRVLVILYYIAAFNFHIPGRRYYYIIIMTILHDSVNNGRRFGLA